MKLLLVEDEFRIAEAIKVACKHFNITIDVFSSGEEGYAIASTEEYDVIILDWMLPDLDGKQICEKLRDEGIETPILFLTARHQTDDVVQILRSGADDYVTKPFNMKELIARIEALARRPRGLKSSILSVGDVKVDTQALTVHRGQIKIHLSKTEFEVLTCLIGHKNQIMSKDRLLRLVWPYDSDVTSNSVEAYIKLLRNKIDKPFPNKSPLIRTVRGFGYTIEDRDA